MLRQYVKIVKRADVVQMTGAGTPAPNDLELWRECTYIYDILIMAITEEKFTIKFILNARFQKYSHKPVEQENYILLVVASCLGQ